MVGEDNKTAMMEEENNRLPTCRQFGLASVGVAASALERPVPQKVQSRAEERAATAAAAVVGERVGGLCDAGGEQPTARIQNMHGFNH